MAKAAAVAEAAGAGTKEVGEEAVAEAEVTVKDVAASEETAA